jgi:glycerophosphoryl diester phosphodiesterase
VGAGFVSHDVAALDMPRVAEIKAAGLPVLCWTVRSKAEEAEARRVADAVTFEGYLP